YGQLGLGSKASIKGNLKANIGDFKARIDVPSNVPGLTVFLEGNLSGIEIGAKGNGVYDPSLEVPGSVEGQIYASLGCSVTGGVDCFKVMNLSVTGEGSVSCNAAIGYEDEFSVDGSISVSPLTVGVSAKVKLILGAEWEVFSTKYELLDSKKIAISSLLQ
ncbi:MAG: hypothetical protein ACRC37_07600, partial [Lentisphaeria bacterium]